MPVLGLFVLTFGGLVLTWCSAALAQANPGQRLPGRLPAVQHPAGYMPAGMLGLVLAACGAMLVCNSTGAEAWLLSAATIAITLAGPMVRHNRRLPHRPIR